MKKLTITLTDAEYDKLVALAAWRTKQAKGSRDYNVQEVIRGFARACQPGGGRWTPPWEGTTSS